MIYKKIIPSSLLGRSIIIIFVPIIVLVILTSFVFYETSWNIISKRLTQSVVADINVIIKLIDQDLKSQAIVNTDSDAYARYMATKTKQKAKNDEIRGVIRDVNELRTEMREIKDLLIGLTNGR